MNRRISVMKSASKLTVSAVVCATAQQAWNTYTRPTSVMRWNKASDDWHCPNATNDLRVGGAFNYRMEACDGSVGFDFEGTFTDVQPYSVLRYAMGEDRSVEVFFEEHEGQTTVSVSFTPEDVHPHELQLAGWQAILNNFKIATETEWA